MTLECNTMTFAHYLTFPSLHHFSCSFWQAVQFTIALQHSKKMGHWAMTRGCYLHLKLLFSCTHPYIPSTSHHHLWPSSLGIMQHTHTSCGASFIINTWVGGRGNRSIYLLRGESSRWSGNKNNLPRGAPALFSDRICSVFKRKQKKRS